MACLFQKIVSFDKESYFCIETINIKLSFHSMNFVEELKWRGMVHTMMPGTEELFEKGIVTAYLGIDPTADSLHIGHLCGVMMLRHFQRCGHKPIALLGGATGMIGDPSGKSQERNLLDENTLRHNQECIKKQQGVAKQHREKRLLFNPLPLCFRRNIGGVPVGRGG